MTLHYVPWQSTMAHSYQPCWNVKYDVWHTRHQFTIFSSSLHADHYAGIVKFNYSLQHSYPSCSYHVIYTCMLLLNTGKYEFINKQFSLTRLFPWHFPTVGHFLRFPRQLSNSLQHSRFSTEVVTLSLESHENIPVLICFNTKSTRSGNRSMQHLTRCRQYHMTVHS